jgi:hypothetical protein
VDGWGARGHGRGDEGDGQARLEGQRLKEGQRFEELTQSATRPEWRTLAIILSIVAMLIALA